MTAKSDSNTSNKFYYTCYRESGSVSCGGPRIIWPKNYLYVTGATDTKIEFKVEGNEIKMYENKKEIETITRDAEGSELNIKGCENTLNRNAT